MTYYIITETSTGLQCGIVSDIRAVRDDPRFEFRPVNARFQAAIDEARKGRNTHARTTGGMT